MSKNVPNRKRKVKIKSRPHASIFLKLVPENLITILGPYVYYLLCEYYNNRSSNYMFDSIN